MDKVDTAAPRLPHASLSLSSHSVEIPQPEREMAERVGVGVEMGWIRVDGGGKIGMRKNYGSVTAPPPAPTCGPPRLGLLLLLFSALPQYMDLGVSQL